MDIKELAQLLNGRQYGEEITEEESKLAKELGFVVVFGQSDDLMEFRGAIDDEADCYNGGIVYLDSEGILEECESNCKYYHKAWVRSVPIEAIWCGGEDYSWTYKIGVLHETFNIYDEDEKYCRGIVFDIKELQVNPESKRKEVTLFAESMEKELKENDYKGGWKNCSLNFLSNKLREETRELFEVMAAPSITNEERKRQILSEAADVGNIAMMIADVCEALEAQNEM